MAARLAGDKQQNPALVNVQNKNTISPSFYGL